MDPDCVMKIKGNVRLTLRKGDEVLWRRKAKNLVVTAGQNLIAALVEAAGSTRPSHMAIGENGAATTMGMTALQGTEHERVAISTVRVDNEVTYTATFGAAIASAVTCQEFGIFNAAAAGTMLARFVTGAFTMDAGYSLEVSWALTFGE